MGCQSKADWCSPVFLQSFFDHSLVPIYTPGWREHGDSKVFCPRTQHFDPTKSNPKTAAIRFTCNFFLAFFVKFTFFHFIFFSGDARCKAFLQPYVDAATHISKYLQNLLLIEPVLSGHPVFSGQLSKSRIWFLIITVIFTSITEFQRPIFIVFYLYWTVI